MGRSAGKANATGFGNTFLGRTSGAAHLSGDNNTFVGRNSGSLATTGFRNAALGHNVGPSLDGLTNSTAHGSEAQVAQSNALVLGGIGPNAVNVGIGTSAPNASVALNITSASKGALLPRRAETARLGIGSPAPSLLLYQADGAQPGFWYDAGTAALPA